MVRLSCGAQNMFCRKGFIWHCGVQAGLLEVKYLTLAQYFKHRQAEVKIKCTILLVYRNEERDIGL